MDRSPERYVIILQVTVVTQAHLFFNVLKLDSIVKMTKLFAVRILIRYIVMNWYSCTEYCIIYFESWVFFYFFYFEGWQLELTENIVIWQ